MKRLQTSRRQVGFVVFRVPENGTVRRLALTSKFGRHHLNLDQRYHDKVKERNWSGGSEWRMVLIQPASSVLVTATHEWDWSDETAIEAQES